MVTQNKLLSIYSESMIPFLSFILKDISDNFNISHESLFNHYLGNIKIKRKRNTNKKGTMTSYAIFLKDTEVIDQIKARYPNRKFGEYSKIKGEIWRTMSSIDKAVYKEKAVAYNIIIKAKKLEEKQKLIEEQTNEIIEEI
tara:strand:+ start:1062 stop:1484 length:423 start_codon:yes stop_codon:yes gene_type:complete